MIQKDISLQNRYLVEKYLGGGGCGETWLVYDRAQNISKVLKVLKKQYSQNPRVIKLFQQEAKILKKLNYPGIPKVEEDGYFTFQAEGHSQPLHCLVMEFIEGQDLEKWMQKQQNQPISQEQALEWLRQLVEILEQVHAQNYFHRDIKPSNIMRKEDGQLTLIDFGIAREVTENFGIKQKQGAVTAIGTYEYIAPEQLEGKAGPESDLFSLGLTFIYLVTNKSIFDFSEDTKTGKLLWRESAPQVSKPLADLIDDLMEPLPKKRPKAQDILQRLSMLSIRLSIEPILSSLPKPLQLGAERILKSEFQQWFKQIRIPKIALYGRSGSGKSSVINAIMGKQVAKVNIATKGTINNDSYEYYRDGWKLKFVDSRGAGDADGKVAFKQAVDYIVNEKVDILLFVIPVGDRDVDKDLKFLEELKTTHKRKYGAELPVILVLNKIDLLLPPREWTPPYNLSLDSTTVDSSQTEEHQTKETNIRECIKARTEEYQTLTDRYVPVCALWDELYEIDVLIETIYNDIPDETAKYAFGRATAEKQLKEAISRRLTLVIAWFTFFLVFSPKFDPNSVLFLQQRLISTIAQLAGNKEDQTIKAQKFLKKLRVENHYAIGALTSTFAVGKAAIDYFIERQEINLVQQAYTQEQKRLEPEFEEAFKGGKKGVFTKLKNTDPELQKRYGLKPIYDEDDDDNNIMPVVPPQA